MKPSRRHSTITVRGLDGQIHVGEGENMAQAARDLGAKHAEQPAADNRYTLTAAGAAIVCADRTQEYLDDATVEAAVRMEQAYSLAERLAQLDEWGG